MAMVGGVRDGLGPRRGAGLVAHCRAGGRTFRHAYAE